MPHLTEAEYLSKTRFPLTNRQKLSLSKQKLLDAINRDDLEGLIENGETLSAEQQDVLGELREKVKLLEAKGPSGSSD